ncbi:TetR/AcrR family transcriptional regulator [Natronoglycomyces albus]|uniref:TetR/AcrR family transcriptional regulator n=1 Tax=Natronoglycomyces albus TaxID=2811108 RepID=UPI001BCC937F|nr:TetR family transcriptional regulator [Natronoglycomyces albus]
MTTPASDAGKRPEISPTQPSGAAAYTSARSKGERTRQTIMDTALKMFVEHGYEKTTMRAIAAEAGVSVGNAYYYFSSKDHLIQGFYEHSTTRHVARARARIAAKASTEKAGKPNLADSIEIALVSWLEVSRPYHKFAGQFFRNAADPDSPLSPFSPESSVSRERTIDLYREILRNTATKVPPQMTETLPQMMWLHQMGLVLFWVYDKSDEQTRSYALARKTAPMVARAITLSRYKLLRPFVKQAEDLMNDFLLGDKAPKESEHIEPKSE